MRVLVDECVPSALRAFLARHGHECVSVQEAGWSGKQDAELLNLAGDRFDVLVTVDTNSRCARNLPTRRIAMLVVLAPSNRLVDLAPDFSACAAALDAIRPGEIVAVGKAS